MELSLSDGDSGIVLEKDDNYCLLLVPKQFKETPMPATRSLVFAMLVLVILAIAFPPTIATGQTFRGSINGTITDPSGAAIPGAKVTGTVLGEGRGDKILVFKLKRKKQYKKMQGHRQNFVEVKINEILVNGKSFKEDKK